MRKELAMIVNNKRALQMLDEYGAHHYHPLPLALRRAKGIKLWDVEENEYIDLLSCYSAQVFGHCHTPLVNALREQAGRLCAPSMAFLSEEYLLWLEAITKLCGMERALAMNTGAEAVETGIKAVRRWGYEVKKIKGDAEIIVCTNNFHGRTTTIVSCSSEKSYRCGFGPFTPGFKLIPYGDVEALKRAITKNTVGFLVEPIQGEAGIIMPEEDYLKRAKQICEENNVLLMLDEIQTGFYRTGRKFCFEYSGIRPDVLMLGKALGGGIMPISAMLASQEVMNVFRPGDHGSTFGGNPLACRVSREVLSLLEKNKDFGYLVRLKGDQLVKGLKCIFIRRDIVKEIRHKGLFIGIELTKKAGGARKFCEALMAKGVVAKETHENVIRVAPPLNITDAEMNFVLGKMEETFGEVYNS